MTVEDCASNAFVSVTTTPREDCVSNVFVNVTAMALAACASNAFVNVNSNGTCSLCLRCNIKCDYNAT